MKAIDKIFHSHKGELKNREIADRGIAEMPVAREELGGLHRHHRRVSSGVGSHFAEAHARVVSSEMSCHVGSKEEDDLRAAVQERRRFVRGVCLLFLLFIATVELNR
jgi:hypothetical protein